MYDNTKYQQSGDLIVLRFDKIWLYRVHNQKGDFSVWQKCGVNEDGGERA